MAVGSIAAQRILTGRIAPPGLPAQPAAKPAAPGKSSFADHLKKACEDINCRTNFSGHAQQRVITRGIELTPEQLTRLDRAVDSAALKGAEKALLMLDDLAMVVGVPQRTVITVVDNGSLRDNVFTAIDAAVIA